MSTGFWKYRTRVGTFFVRQSHGRWHALFEDESLGSYQTPAHALDDLVGGHTFWPSNGVDPSTVGLPTDLSEWEIVRTLARGAE
jgi:hypothetical protein